ncbi:hypothetical protein FPV67DRAFT_1671629 [Lyophyllum atratum]|nr:hypothetical protein FPV67DRAFT_1671629 [Lyophyllum atratum]
MTRLPFSLLALSERLESVIGAIQTSLAVVPDRSAADALSTAAATELAAWRAHRPYLERLMSYPHHDPVIMDRDGTSSIEGTDGSDTLVSDDEAAHSYYALPAVQVERPAYVLGGKILLDIANFDRELDVEKEAHAHVIDDSASDSDTFYSYEGGHEDSEVDDEAAPTCTAGPASRTPDLTECITALAPPPLRHSGKTRSKVMFIPRDAPGTCSIHGCADCGLCDPDKPLLFII